MPSHQSGNKQKKQAEENFPASGCALLANRGQYRFFEQSAFPMRRLQRICVRRGAARNRSLVCHGKAIVGFVSVPFKNEKQHAVILSVAPLILQWPFHDRPSFYFGPRLSGRKCAASAALGTRSARKSGIGRGSRATRIQTLENFLPPVFSAYFRIDGLVSDCVFKRQSAGARRACSAHRTGWGNRSGSANQR